MSFEPGNAMHSCRLGYHFGQVIIRAGAKRPGDLGLSFVCRVSQKKRVPILAISEPSFKKNGLASKIPRRKPGSRDFPAALHQCIRNRTHGHVNKSSDAKLRGVITDPPPARQIGSAVSSTCQGIKEAKDRFFVCESGHLPGFCFKFFIFLFSFLCIGCASMTRTNADAIREPWMVYCTN